MSTCLGLYIEDNIIKYAKVSKDNDIVKIDSFGIKFFDKISDAISQVIEETYSYKVPISINLSNENYNYFYLFSLLNKKDMQNVVNTEFEAICYDRGLNKDTFETRYVLVTDLEDKDKIKAIHVSASKADLARKEQQLEGYRVVSASPMGTTIGNIADFQEKENVLIVNIEDKTTITTIVDKRIIDVNTIDEGANQILTNICSKENSYLKAYEICKNTTIYTQEGQDLRYEENDYLDYIMPTLYNIVGAVRKITNDSLNKIDKVYITGTASVINNIDIYFQEYLKDIKCEILKPYFINNVLNKINVKDYIEVNSAIALALQGLGEGLKGMNFKKETVKDKYTQLISSFSNSKIVKNINKKSGKKINFNLNFKLNMNLKGRLTALEQTLIRISYGLLMVILIYSGISIYLNNLMNNKATEIEEATKQVKAQISTINSNTSKLKENKSKYETMTKRLTDINSTIEERRKIKNAIPTLLNQIMFSIPKGVQITSIENASGTKIIINAQANTYEQLGYFKASIKNYNILTNVISDSGIKTSQDGPITTTIEGNLPID